MKKNIKHIIDNALCTSCGACSGICPFNVIEMKYNVAGYLYAHINQDDCTNCGMCLDICPSNPLNSPNSTKNDIFHGQSLGSYIGYAIDDNTRAKSQSGGVVSALLCYLIEKKLVDAVIVNMFNEETRKPEGVLVDSKEGVIRGAGSYYAQSAVVETILKAPKNLKIAAVVLGCQAESLENIADKYPNLKLPEYKLGLFCAGQNSSCMIDDLIKQSSICLSEHIKEFRFRDKALGMWPGNIGIYTDKNIYEIKSSKRFALKPVYESFRCLLCYDQTNIYSDIVFGDPWGINHKDREKGFSVIIARTEKGKKLLESAKNDGYIYVENMPLESIFKGQTVDKRHKTKFFTAQSICNTNCWMYPYNSEVFKNIVFQKADLKKKNDLKERLNYTRQLNFEKNRAELEKMFLIKKKRVNRTILIRKSLAFFKRVINYGFRKITKR